MSLFQKIEEDLKLALKSREELTVSTLRFLISAIKNQEIEKQRELTDEEVVQILQKQIKQRRESITAFQSGRREDLALKEKKELEILSKYLPQQLTPKELEEIVKEVIAQLGPTPKDFGKVMGQVMAKVKGKAEGSLVSQTVKEALGV